MNRTITALYETQAEAERVRDALVTAKLGQHVDIHTQEAAAAPAKGGVVEWLSGLFRGHHDSHLYAEGLRRGHVLLTVKVDDLNETRAAEIMDAAAPVPLHEAERSWRAQGWSPAVGLSRPNLAEPARTVSNVRSYTL